MMKQPAALRLENRQGFTLIELMIVVAIIGILSVISIPNFLMFQAKARQAEAKAALGAIFTAATTVLLLDNGTYAVSNIRQLPFSVAGLSRYSFWYDVNGTPTAVPGSSTATSPCDVRSVTAFITPAASATGFTASSKGNVDSDTTCDEWSINDARILENPSNDVTN
jgi:prepilin-type N-terminal cleavage/methylation domain-containing protein